MPNAAAFVYVANADSQDVSVFALAANGDLTPVETVAVPGPAEPGSTLPLAISPDKQYLFAGLRNAPFTVATFAIDRKTGSLAYVGSGPLADSMAYIATDRTGNFLFGASYGGNKVTVSRIGANGVVAPAHQIVDTKPSAHCILPDASNRHVFHTALGGDVIYQQRFDAAAGRLTPNEPNTVSVKDKAGPRHIAFAPGGAFAYLINELDASIYVFPYDAANGRLGQEIQVVSALPKDFSGKPWGADIHLTPDGRLLYASERGSHSLAAFRVDARSGMLMLIGNFPTERQPRGFNIDPGGRLLLAVGQLSNSMTVHAIGESGDLSVLKRYAVGKNPNWVEIVSSP